MVPVVFHAPGRPILEIRQVAESVLLPLLPSGKIRIKTNKYAPSNRGALPLITWIRALKVRVRMVIEWHVYVNLISKTAYDTKLVFAALPVH